jgi:hypothetical protein
MTLKIAFMFIFSTALEVSAVSQNQPVRVEIKGFKNRPLFGSKNGPGQPDNCRHVSDVLKVRLADDDTQFCDRGCSQRRIVRELGISREMVDRYLRLAEAKPAISTPARKRVLIQTSHSDIKSAKASSVDFKTEKVAGFDSTLAGRF